MQQTTQAIGDFETARFNAPKTRDNSVEHAIASHDWRAIVIGSHEVDHIAQDSMKFAEAFKGDCFIFETKDAHDRFFAQAHPVAASQISMGTLGYIEHAQDGPSHPIFKRVNCVVCIGHPQSKIMSKIRRDNKNIKTDPIDLDALISAKAKRKPSCEQTTPKPLPV